MGRTAAGIVIGNEVLSGKVEEANGAYLVKALRPRGIDLRSIAVVPDDIDAIVDAVSAARFKVDLVVTSGGVGPTHDDVTVRAVALALGREVVCDAAMAELVRTHYGARFTPEALRLANTPAGAEFVPVPGVWLPVLKVENIALLPGVPELFRKQLDGVLATLGDRPFTLRCVYLNEGETGIAAALDEVAYAHPEVAIGSYPRFDAGADHKVKVTLEARDAVLVERALEALLDVLPEAAVVRVE